MARVYNFSAGPSTLPEKVLEQAAAEMMDYQGSGQSVMEMSHRSKVFDKIIKDAEALMRELYNIPDACTNIEDGILMWVEASDKSYYLFVDKLIGEHQVVVKPLPPYLQQFHIKDSGISGCTILGDGNISIILDIAHVYEAARGIF